MGEMDYLKRISQCDVVYNSTGESDRSSMPIGNGELCASVWTENERLMLYLSRSDALTELDRTVKLGLVELKICPNPFRDGLISQRLCVADGIIKISTRLGTLYVFVASDSDTLWIRGEFDEPASACARYISWREEKHRPEGEYPDENVFESPDTVEAYGDSILFYHENGETVIPSTARLQDLGDSLEAIPDTLGGRLFGGMMSFPCGTVTQGNPLVTEPADRFSLCICTASAQEDREAFISDLAAQMAKRRDSGGEMENTVRWWNAYWRKSHVWIEGDEPQGPKIMDSLRGCAKEPSEYSTECPSRVTLAYTLTKYMFRCCNTGKFPVLYNGMLFNLMPGGGEHFGVESFGRTFTAKPGEIGPGMNPDERSWCAEHLWQNLRHPYHSLLARGELEPFKGLFAYYRRFWELNRLRAERYYGASGQHNTEMTLSFGLQSVEIYGADRTGKPQGYAQNRAGGSVDVSPGLELIALMLDYYDYTGDKELLQSEILPYAYELLRYIETRFPERTAGKLLLSPLHAVETYPDALNPLPVIAGLHSVLERISGLPPELVREKAFFDAYMEMLPPIPMREAEGEKLLAPAGGNCGQRQNVEPVELYAVFPFKNFTHAKRGLELARNTFFRCGEEYDVMRPFIIGETPGAPSYSGWQTVGVCAAYLGLADIAGEILSQNCAQKNPGTRFPAMWGPIYDAVPDTDHGANILTLTQAMLLQADGDKIYLLPAWPASWDVDFALHAPCGTLIRCSYRDKELKLLEVVPEARKKDVVRCL